MTSAMKNRLVGTIVLVALAVIFLPDVLDGKKRSNQGQFTRLPDRPEAKQVDPVTDFPHQQVAQNVARPVEIINQPVQDALPQVQPQAPAQANTASNAAATEQDNTERAAVVRTDNAQSATNQSSDYQVPDIANTPETVQQDLPNAGWVVQLGVFRHQKNVRELLDTLKKAGYLAFSHPIQTSSGELTKVFVGPDLQKDKLEKALPHLKEITNLQGRIAPFKV